MLSIKIIKPASEREGKNALSKRLIKQLKNSSIEVKKSELPQQMESLVSFFRNGLGVKVSFQGVIQEHADVFIQMDYFHLFIMYLDRPVSVPQSPEINYHLFSFVRMQVRV